ncbi:hypothetical protein KIL84_001458 [Mauremys mutica]|uniref:Uncharacterized protein n=1 Tax=Mauremys mutica TaxID=74926 RepID=A0A9D4ATQ6_9SAUR|nr:hypothetical protein KIL84_001458 [Mauremys mutica]
MIRTDKDEYFIEPLERGKQMEEERGRIHVVYRRSAVTQDPGDMLLDFHTEGCSSFTAEAEDWYSLAKEIIIDLRSTTH